MAGGVISVDGWRELDSSLRSYNRAADRELRREFAKAGEVVAEASRRKISVFQGARTQMIRSRAIGKGVIVAQNAQKVTGKRGDFGSAQMRRMLAARDENTDRTVEALEDALDRVAAWEGFA